MVVEVKGNDQYTVRVDGSGRMTVRNRRFLKKITLYVMTKHFKTGDSPVGQPLVVSETAPPLRSSQSVPDLPLQSPPPVPESEAVPDLELVGPPVVATPPDLQLDPEQRSTETLRRSSRTSKQTDRLQMSWGTKSYAQELSIN